MVILHSVFECILQYVIGFDRKTFHIGIYSIVIIVRTGVYNPDYQR